MQKYKRPSSVEEFRSIMKVDKQLILANAAVISAATLAGSLITNDLNAIAGGLALAYGGLPALALAQNASKLKNMFTERFYPEKFKQQQQDVRTRVDELVSGNSNESILAIANDAVDKNMISGSKLGAIRRSMGESLHIAISSLDRLTEDYIAPVTASKAGIVKADNFGCHEQSEMGYESYNADELERFKP
jgi:phosphoheptose isomerase